jgi:hypothetical protein
LVIVQCNIICPSIYSVCSGGALGIFKLFHLLLPRPFHCLIDYFICVDITCLSGSMKPA